MARKVEEVWFERVPGGTHMPTNMKGLVLTLRYILVGALGSAAVGSLASTLFGDMWGLGSGAIFAVGTVLRFSHVAERHSAPR